MKKKKSGKKVQMRFFKDETLFPGFYTTKSYMKAK